MQLIYTDISEIQLNNVDLDKLTKAIPVYFGEKVRTSGNERLKLQRLASGLLFTYAVRQEGYDAGKAEIMEGERGKPELICPDGLYFNLSHSEGLVLMTLCDAGVGCDIQKIKDGKKVAEHFFADVEKRALADKDEAERDRFFTWLWARKESYIKATGEGMKRDLRSFSVLDDAMPDGCTFESYDLGGYMAAVCARGPFDRVDIRLIPFQKIADVIS